jgi:hypothetical protein
MGTREKLFRQKLADQVEKLTTHTERVFTSQKLSKEWLDEMAAEITELNKRLTVYQFVHELAEDENLQIEFLELEDAEIEEKEHPIPSYGDEILKEIDEFDASQAVDIEAEDEVPTAPEVSVEQPEEKEPEVSIKPKPNQEKISIKVEINDMVAKEDQSLADRLRKKSIRKLAESIALNERFLFSNELFNGNMEAFNRALNELDHIASLDDARRFIDIQLKEQHQWKMDSEVVQSFVMLVERRFN